MFLLNLPPQPQGKQYSAFLSIVRTSRDSLAYTLTAISLESSNSKLGFAWIKAIAIMIIHGKMCIYLSKFGHAFQLIMLMHQGQSPLSHYSVFRFPFF